MLRRKQSKQSFCKSIFSVHMNVCYLQILYCLEKEVSDKLNLLGTLARIFKGKGSVAFVNCGYVEF